MRIVTFQHEDAFVEIAHPLDSQEDQREVQHHDLIVDAYVPLAASGYEGHRQFGRGVVTVVPKPSTFRAALLAYAAHPIGFLPAEHLGLYRSIAPAALRWLAQQTERYDPETTTLVLVEEPGHPSRAYALDASVPPPDAATRVLALRN